MCTKLFVKKSLAVMFGLGLFSATAAMAQDEDTMIVIDEDTSLESVVEEFSILELPDSASDTARESAASGLDTANQAREQGSDFGREMADTAREEGREMGMEAAEEAREQADDSRELGEAAREDAAENAEDARELGAEDARELGQGAGRN
jgi:hypothetical protein